MNRREFLEKIGTSAAILASFDMRTLLKTSDLADKTKLMLDQSDLSSELTDFVEVYTNEQIYKIPVYRLK
jgi:hypothetical protein